MSNENNGNGTAVLEANEVKTTTALDITLDEGLVMLAEGYIRAARKNDKTYLCVEDAILYVLRKGLENFTKAEERLWDIAANKGYMKDKADLDRMFAVLSNSKSPMSLDTYVDRLRAIDRKWGKGGTQA